MNAFEIVNIKKAEDEAVRSGGDPDVFIATLRPENRNLPEAQTVYKQLIAKKEQEKQAQYSKSVSDFAGTLKAPIEKGFQPGDRWYEQSRSAKLDIPQSSSMNKEDPFAERLKSLDQTAMNMRTGYSADSIWQSLAEPKEMTRSQAAGAIGGMYPDIPQETVTGHASLLKFKPDEDPKLAIRQAEIDARLKIADEKNKTAKQIADAANATRTKLENLRAQVDREGITAQNKKSLVEQYGLLQRDIDDISAAEADIAGWRTSNDEDKLRKEQYLISIGTSKKQLQNIAGQLGEKLSKDIVDGVDVGITKTSSGGGSVTRKTSESTTTTKSSSAPKKSPAATGYSKIPGGVEIIAKDGSTKRASDKYIKDMMAKQGFTEQQVIDNLVKYYNK